MYAIRSYYVQQLQASRGANKTAVALANKLARIGWAILRRRSVYRASAAVAAVG